MYKSLKTLQDNLKKIIELNTDNREVFEKVAEETKDIFREGVVADIFNQRIEIHTLTEIKCYFLAKALMKIITPSYLSQLAEKEGIVIDIDINNYFTDKEIAQINVDALELANHNRTVTQIEIDNMRHLKEGHWIGVVTLEQWADLMNENIFIYKAGELQREGVKKEMEGRIVTQPYINDTNVHEIKEMMLSGDYVTDPITISVIRTDNMEENKYIKRSIDSIRNTTKEKQKERQGEGLCPFNDIIIEINGKCPIYLTDGMHRSLAIQQVVAEAIAKNKFDVLNQSILINFTYWDFQKTTSFIHQMQQGTKMPKRYEKTLNTGKNNAVLLARELNREGNEKINELFNRLVTNQLELKYDGYCLLETFADSLEIGFKNMIEKPRKYGKVKSYLKVFYNELLGIFKEKYDADNLKELRDLVIVENNMFIFYNAIAKEMYNSNIEEDAIGDYLENLLNKIDWQRNNRTWDDNGIFSISSTKTGIEKILQLGYSTIKEVL